MELYGGQWPLIQVLPFLTGPGVEGAVEKDVKETVVQKVVKEKEGKISIYNMKAVAKKVFTPGAFEDDSEDE